ncbi:MAG: beta strand repeat-containing protein, partial [Anaerolineales bacterium]
QYQRPEIAIDANTFDGITIGGAASNILVEGLTIYDANNGVYAPAGAGTNRTVRYNLIGTLPDGTDPGAERNALMGVRVVDPSELTVTSNYIGYNGTVGINGNDPDSTLTVTYNEVFSNGSTTNSHDGIDINGINSLVQYNLSRDNTNLSGTPENDSGTGIEVGSTAPTSLGNNTIDNNTISNNLGAGISVRNGNYGNTITNNIITGNQVGVAVNVETSGQTDANTISQNSIYGNTSIGIDLRADTLGGFDGVTSNDAGDGDTGSNALLNFPVLYTATISGSNVTVTGETRPGATVEFFEADGDASGYGEGQTFVASKVEGSGDDTSSAAGTVDGTANQFAFTFPAGSLIAGDELTATATDASGNTSEFALNVPVTNPTALYRSVGTTATDLNTSSRTVEISGTTATFSGQMPNNVGVGDVLVYNNGSNQLAFITSRSSSTVFTVADKAGATPASATAGTAVGVFRAYTSLFNWEASTENPNITEPVENDVNPSTDLVAAGTIMMVAAYGDGADTTSVTINSWNTGPVNYIKIYTPTSASEVGVTQRHSGVWDTSKYYIETAGRQLDVQEGYVRIEGLQIHQTSVTQPGDSGIIVAAGAQTGEYYFSHNLIRGVTSGTWHTGIEFYTVGANSTAYIWNNIIYDFGNSTFGYAMNPTDPDLTSYIYNNTMYANGNGILEDTGTGVAIAKNNLAFGITGTEYSGMDAGSDNNMGEDPAFPQDLNYVQTVQTETQITVDPFGTPRDLHLTAGSDAIGTGADLSADANLPFSDDIDGDARSGSWDIGADEDYSPPLTTLYYSVGTDNTALYSGNASATGGTLTLASAAVDSIGVGDEVRLGANRYYITGRTSSTVFSIQNSAANGGTVGDTSITFGSTAITIYRAFNSLSAAFLNATTGALDSSHMNTADLVASNFQLNIAGYNDGPDPSMYVRIEDPYVTGPSNYIRVYTPTDTSEVGVSQRHTGTAGSGYRIAPSGPATNQWFNFIFVNTNNGYVRIEGIEIDGSGVTNGENLRGLLANDSAGAQQDVRFTHNLIHDIINSNFDDTDPSRVSGIMLDNTDNAKVSNNIIFNLDSVSSAATGGVRGIRAVTAGKTHYIYNNTLYDIQSTSSADAAYGIHDSAGSTIIARNNYVGLVYAGVAFPEFGYWGTFNSEDYNVSFDGSTSGPNSVNSQASYTTYFIDSRAGSTNLHLTSDSNALWGTYGADLDSDPNWPITDDVDGDTRDATQPDVGADEYSGTAGASYWLYDDTTPMTFMMFPTPPSGTDSLSTNGGNFYSDLLSNGSQLAAGTTTVYLNVQTSSLRTITLNLYGGATLLGTTSWDIDTGGVTQLLSKSFSTVSHNFDGTERLRLEVSGSFGSLPNGLKWDGSNNNSRVFVPPITSGVAWWDSNYQYRAPITVSAGASAIPANYPTRFQFDHAGLVTATKSLASGDDARIVYWNGSTWTELDRIVFNDGINSSSWNSATSTVMFKTVNGIAASGTDTGYYLYYGYPSAVSPPSNTPSSRYYRAQQLTEFTTTNQTTYQDTGASLTFTPSATTEHWVVVATWRQRDTRVAGATEDLGEARVRINGTPRTGTDDIGFRQSADAYISSGALFKITGTTASQTVDVQFRAVGGSFDDAIDDIRILAFMIPDPAGADIQYQEDLGRVSDTVNPTTAQTLTFTPSSAGDYIWLANGFHHEGNGGATTGGLFAVDETGIDQQESDESYMVNISDSLVNIMHFEQRSLGSGSQTFEIRHQPDITQGSDRQGLTTLLFRSDIFEGVETADDPNYTATANTSPQTKVSLTTATQASERDYVYLAVMMHDDGGTGDGLAGPSYADLRHAGNPMMSTTMQIDRGGYDTNIQWASAEYTAGNQTVVGRYWSSGATVDAITDYAHILALRYKEPGTSLGLEE